MWIPEIASQGTIHYPCSCEIKFDGEFVQWDGNKCRNKRGIEKSITNIMPEGEVFYGELYYGEGKEFYSELHSHQGISNKMIVFDTAGYGVEPYVKRRHTLDSRNDIISVPYRVCYNQREVKEYFEEVSNRGYEGIVVKPLESLTDTYWIKMKREFCSTLIVKGVRKDRLNTIAVGTEDKVLGYCSLLGWDIVRQMLELENPKFNKEDKECFYFNSLIKLEIKHNGIIEPSGKLRHPRIKRIRDYSEPIEV